MIPNIPQQQEVLVGQHIRQEQVEQERALEKSDDRNVHFRHDPLWNRRFWSIQHVHDCIEGKTFHWFWSPMAEVFSLSQILFMIGPFAMYLNADGHLSILQLTLWVLIFKCFIVAAKHALEWYHNWRFIRVYRLHKEHA